MANAVQDKNNVPSLLGVDSSDLKTPTRISANPTTGALLIDGPSLYPQLDTRYLKLDGTNSPTANISWDSNRIVDLADPVDAQDAATKNYVDSNTLWSESSNILSPKTDGDGVFIDVPTASRSALVLQTTDDDATENLFNAYKADGTTSLMSLTADGKVGIGIKSPTSKLHIVESATTPQFTITRTSATITDRMAEFINTADGEAQIAIQAGATTNKKRYINFQNYDGGNSWTMGVNDTNNFVVYDNTSGIHRLWFRPDTVGAGESFISSVSTGAVEINAFNETSYPGTGGLRIWGGGETPTLVHTLSPTDVVFNAPTQIRTEDYEALKVANSGNVSLFNVDTISNFVSITANNSTILDISRTSDGSGVMNFTSRSDTFYHYPYLKYQRARSGNAAVQNGDYLGGFSLYGRGTSTWALAGGLAGRVLGTPSGNNVPGQLLFYTYNDAGAVRNNLQISYSLIETDGAFKIDGVDDAVQLIVQANSTQIDNMQENQDASGNVLSGVDGRGILFSYGGNDSDSFYAGGNAGNIGSTGEQNVGIGGNTLSSNTTGGFNLALGYDALMSNESGLYNVALGTRALRLNNSGQSNVALGRYALEANTTGSYCVAIGKGSLADNNANYNIGIGYRSLYQTSSGGQNIAIGALALFSNTTATYNVAIGYSSLVDNTEGVRNVGIGAFTLGDNIDGGNNMAIGYQSLRKNTSGIYNVGVGSNTLIENLTGSYNIAIGGTAMQLNTIGQHNVAIGFDALGDNIDGSYHVAIGDYSLRRNTEGDNNVAIGYAALTYNSTGNRNMAIGPYALTSLTTGNYNTAIGMNALTSVTTGNGNVGIGYYVAQSNDGIENTVIGYQAGYNSTGDSNVFLGYGAGYNEMGDNKLYIVNSSTATPLIYGEFDNSLFRINGSQEIIGNADVIQFKVRANATQTTNLTEWQNSSGTVFASVSSNGTLNTQSGRIVKTTTVNTATYDLLESDDVLLVTYTSTGAVTSLTIPTAQVVDGRRITIKDAGGNAATNNITVDTEGSETIDGRAIYTLNSDYESITMVSDGSNLYVI